MDPVTSVLLRKQSPHGFLQAHLAACAAGGNSSRGKSCQPQPSWLPWSLLCQSCHWSRCLPLAGCSPEVASDRPSGQSYLLSVSHSTGIFSQKHNQKGKAADHTISPITTKFATKKYSKCKCIHTSNLWLRADENKPQALSLPTERQAVETSEKLSSPASSAPTLPYSLRRMVFLASHKIRRCTQKLPWNPAVLYYESWWRRQRAQREWGEGFVPSSSCYRRLLARPQLPALCPQGRRARVLQEYEFRALRWQHQTALRAGQELGKDKTTESCEAAAIEEGQVSRKAEEGAKSSGLWEGKGFRSCFPQAG